MEKQNYIDGLKRIQEARNTHSRNINYIFKIGVMSTAVGIFVPPILLICALIAIAYWYSHVKTARVKCPRCGNPFGTNDIIPLGIGTNQCESCKLSLDIVDPNKNVQNPHSDEWLK